MRTQILCAVVAVSGCNLTSDVPTVSTALPHALPDDVFETLKDPAGAHAELCDHDATDTTFPADADRITNRFCQPTVPQPTGLGDLLRILDLDFKSPDGNGVGGNPAFAILGHSSALTAREVSSITPTASCSRRSARMASRRATTRSWRTTRARRSSRSRRSLRAIRR